MMAGMMGDDARSFVGLCASRLPDSRLPGLEPDDAVEGAGLQADDVDLALLILTE